jgi:hypothetical protein
MAVLIAVLMIGDLVTALITIKRLWRLCSLADDRVHPVGSNFEFIFQSKKLMAISEFI